MDYQDKWRLQRPISLGSPASQSNAPIGKKYQKFRLVPGAIWMHDPENRERYEWAGPWTNGNFEISIDYKLPDNLLIADPKLTLFQIHSYIIDRDKDFSSAKPVVMFNIRCRNGSGRGRGVSWKYEDVYWEVRFRDPNHDNTRPNYLWLPDIGKGQGCLPKNNEFSVCSDVKRQNDEMTVKLKIKSEKSSDCFNFKLNRLGSILGAGSMLKLYPKFGAYRSVESGIGGFENACRPDQTVNAKLYKYTC